MILQNNHLGQEFASDPGPVSEHFYSRLEELTKSKSCQLGTFKWAHIFLNRV